MPALLLASRNKGKLKEFMALLKDQPMEITTPERLRLEQDVLEKGMTYAQNAILKAIAYAQASSMVTLADDSGLEVEALGGAPGLYSARFSPKPGATDADRRARLLDTLQGIPRPWKAQFRCAVALATPEGQVRTAEGACSGEIIPEERGQGGFGYDPIFLVDGLGKTMAELSMDEKNQVSHRARAVKAALPILLEMLR